MKRKMRIIHPGEILREEIIVANGLKISKAAEFLGISRQMLHNITQEKSDITPEMAFRIAQVFGGSPEIWANMQTKYNLHLASEKAKSFKLKRYEGQTESI